MLVERAEALGLCDSMRRQRAPLQPENDIFKSKERRGYSQVILGPVGMTKCLLSEQT